MASVYRPRMYARLTVPVAGSRQQKLDLEAKTGVVNLELHPKACRLEKNDHNQADTCTLTLDWTEAGVDARMLDDAVVQLHIGNADERGHWEPSTKDCRFCGIVREVISHRPGDDAAEVTLECADYTAAFLAAKPFGSLGVPKLSQTISEAWQTIVGMTVIDGKEHEHTPGTGIFRNNPGLLILQGVDPNLVIGKGVSERFRSKFDKVQTKPETDAWAVWQQCVGMLGLISYIEKDHCIVTTATNYYTEHDAPKMLWGKNIESWHESRVAAQAKRGIHLTSFDPELLRTVEADWPPVGDKLVQKKRAQPAKKMSTEQARIREERDYFTFPAVTDAQMLEEIAKRVYEERSRQELEGGISTPHMNCNTERGKFFDLLDLKAGETIRVEVEPGLRPFLDKLGSEGEQVRYLTQRGYSSGAAELIVANMKNFSDLEARFLTKRVGIDLSVSDTGGSFAIDIDYVNRIQLDGSAT